VLAQLPAAADDVHALDDRWNIEEAKRLLANALVQIDALASRSFPLARRRSSTNLSGTDFCDLTNLPRTVRARIVEIELQFGKREIRHNGESRGMSERRRVRILWQGDAER
jgi:hypothetical protein